MRAKILGLVAFAGITWARGAEAAFLVVEGPMGTPGCYAEKDLSDIDQAMRKVEGSAAIVSGMTPGLREVINNKVWSHKCFVIHPGQTAVMDFKWETLAAAKRNHVILVTRDGKRFYARSGTWMRGAELAPW